MDVEAAVFGCGRIGAGTAALLRGFGVDVVVIDRDCGRVRELERGLGVEGACLDVLHAGREAVRGACRGAVAAATAFPGSVGFECVRRVVEAGFEGVADVTFYRGDPLALDGVARSSGTEAYVDAGLAPGLSNLLVGEAYARLLRGGGVRDALVYVGGLSASADCPLGLAGTWNVRDLLDEYVRPARLVRGGRVVAEDPLATSGEVEVPGVGRFEYFVSDGLRTMLSTLPPPEGVMAEYTLRYPGHLRVVRVLKELGLLSEDLVVANGVPVKPVDVVAAKLEEVLRGCREDRVVMYVRVDGVEGAGVGWVLDVGFDARRGLSAMTLTTSGTQASVVKAFLDGALRLGAGAHGLEEVGLKGLSKHVLANLRSLGVTPNPV